MPGWSPEIANEFIRMAASDGRAFDQMQLQELVYIAHGWCLAILGQPLTGDRPEALPYGPEFRRLADALADYGVELVTREISEAQVDPYATMGRDIAALSELDAVERDILARVFQEYGRFDAARLAILTRRPGTPWAEIFADGAGELRDIPHDLIRAQFVKLAKPKN